MRLNKVLMAATIMVLMAFTMSITVKAEVKLTPDGLKFDAEYYALNNPEIAQSYGTTFDDLYRHYLEHGKAEGRLPYATAKEDNVLEGGVGTEVKPIAESVTLNPDLSKIFVGDSRTAVMHREIGEDSVNWIGYPGTKYDTLMSKVVPMLDNTNLNGKQIVILYGINDITFCGAQKTFDNYNLFLNTKAQEWIQKGASVYFVNLVGISTALKLEAGNIPAPIVNHVNREVAVFNSMMSRFPSNIHRIYVEYGADPFYDGIHYNTQTCVSVYNQINRSL